jgi:hypothetical protein
MPDTPELGSVREAAQQPARLGERNRYGADESIGALCCPLRKWRGGGLASLVEIVGRYVQSFHIVEAMSVS